MYSLITACKRSLGQGNVFTPICQSFCSQGEVYPSMQFGRGCVKGTVKGVGCGGGEPPARPSAIAF